MSDVETSPADRPQTEAAGVTLFVCATCRPVGHDDAAPRPGALLAAHLAEQAEPGIAVKAVQCLSVCKRPCTVAVSGPGKFTYVIADVEPDAHADDLLAFAAAHAASADGVTPWRERPEIVKRSVVSRVPALGQASSLVTEPEHFTSDKTIVSPTGA